MTLTLTKFCHVSGASHGLSTCNPKRRTARTVCVDKRVQRQTPLCCINRTTCASVGGVCILFKADLQLYVGSMWSLRLSLHIYLHHCEHSVSSCTSNNCNLSSPSSLSSVFCVFYLFPFLPTPPLKQKDEGIQEDRQECIIQ